MSVPPYLLPSLVPLKAVLDGSPSYRWMAFTPISLVGFTEDWLNFLVGITISDFGGSVWHAGSQGVLDCLLVAVVRTLQIAVESEYPYLPQQLEEQVDIVGHNHEFGQNRSSEDGVVG
jgi:hypothetical protein